MCPTTVMQAQLQHECVNHLVMVMMMMMVMTTRAFESDETLVLETCAAMLGR